MMSSIGIGPRWWKHQAGKNFPVINIIMIDALTMCGRLKGETPETPVSRLLHLIHAEMVLHNRLLLFINVAEHSLSATLVHERSPSSYCNRSFWSRPKTISTRYT